MSADDDSGPGLTAAFSYEIPEDGNYGLIVAGALSSLGGGTFGDYRLLIGVDAPQVLEGTGEPTGDVIAILDLEATPQGEKIEESTGVVTVEEPQVQLNIADARPGDTLYVYVEATSGDLAAYAVAAELCRQAGCGGQCDWRRIRRLLWSIRLRNPDETSDSISSGAVRNSQRQASTGC